MRLDIAPEMVAFHEMGEISGKDLPHPVEAFVFDLMEGSFHRLADPSPSLLDAAPGDARLVLIVARAACARMREGGTAMVSGQSYHLPQALRSVLSAIAGGALPQGLHTLYRAAKCVELLCETVQLEMAGKLVPHSPAAGLSIADSERLLAAHRLIEERCAEKLTIAAIARLCGLNRGKLTRGFRGLFDCSVADAIAEQRLSQAGTMLLTTDLPVSSIGYRCGYLNNASFTRAFGRRYGVAPTRYRATRLAA